MSGNASVYENNSITTGEQQAILKETNLKLTKELAQLRGLISEQEEKCSAEKTLKQSYENELISLQTVIKTQIEYENLKNEKAALLANIAESDAIFQKECEEKAEKHEAKKRELLQILATQTKKNKGGSKPVLETKPKLSTRVKSHHKNVEANTTNGNTNADTDTTMNKTSVDHFKSSSSSPKAFGTKDMHKSKSLISSTSSNIQSTVAVGGLETEIMTEDDTVTLAPSSMPKSFSQSSASVSTSVSKARKGKQGSRRISVLGPGYVGGCRKPQNKTWIDSDSDNDNDPYALPINTSETLAQKLSTKSQSQSQTQSQSSLSKKRLFGKKSNN